MERGQHEVNGLKFEQVVRIRFERIINDTFSTRLPFVVDRRRRASGEGGGDVSGGVATAVDGLRASPQRLIWGVV